MTSRYPSDSSWMRTSAVPRREAVVNPRRAPAAERIHQGRPARPVARAPKALRRRVAVRRLRDAPIGQTKSPRPRYKESRR
jgi:hypothetical protein